MDLKRLLIQYQLLSGMKICTSILIFLLTPEAFNELSLCNYFVHAGSLVLGSQTKPKIPPKISYASERVLARTESVNFQNLHIGTKVKHENLLGTVRCLHPNQLLTRPPSFLPRSTCAAALFSPVPCSVTFNVP